MSKHAKKNEPKKGTGLRESHTQDDALFEARVSYDPEPKEDTIQPAKLPRALYFAGAGLILVIIGLIVWMNLDNLRPENIASWWKQQAQGENMGDGFPVTVKGNVVNPGNFWHIGSNVAALSDTALTVMDISGKEQYSVQHSFENPGYSTTGDRTLLFNQGGKGYMLLSGGETKISEKLKVSILAGTVSREGSFALAVQGSNYAAELHVYNKEGTEKYVYHFADHYITSVSINSAGTMAAVTSIGSQKGEMRSKITILDFTQEKAVSEMQVSENMLLQVLWGENNTIYAVGDSATLVANSQDYQFTSYSYDGKQVTAMSLEGSRVAVSISGYTYEGACTLLLFRENASPVQVQTQERVRSLSLYGESIGTLQKSSGVIYDFITGNRLADIPVDSDAKALSMANEQTAYILAISEIRQAAPVQ